jgi:lipocalin-like protein
VTIADDMSSRFVGAWRLLSCEARDSSGGAEYPFGEHATGQLFYDAVGNMSAQLMRADRARFAARDPALGTDAEVRNAFDSYVAYFGTYSIDISRSAVTHHVTGASFPNWIGVDLVRQFRFENDAHLTLSTPPIEVGGRTLAYVLLWERMA